MILTKTDLKSLEEAKNAEEILRALEEIGQSSNCPNTTPQDSQMPYS
jgi:hypothetical protein